MSKCTYGKKVTLQKKWVYQTVGKSTCFELIRHNKLAEFLCKNAAKLPCIMPRVFLNHLYSFPLLPFICISSKGINKLNTRKANSAVLLSLEWIWLIKTWKQGNISLKGHLNVTNKLQKLPQKNYISVGSSVKKLLVQNTQAQKTLYQKKIVHSNYPELFIRGQKYTTVPKSFKKKN